MSQIVLGFLAALFCAMPVALFAQAGPARPNDEIPQRMDKERSNSGGKSEWERQQEERGSSEGEIAFPASPKGGLIEFFVSGGTSFRFFIDPASLSVGPDGVVRYTLIARSPSGVETVTYEGIRCNSGAYNGGTFRVYAFANDGVWSKNGSAEWQEIEPKTVQRWHNVLRGNYFCPNRLSIVTAAEGLDALRRGGHPAATNTGR